MGEVIVPVLFQAPSIAETGTEMVYVLSINTYICSHVGPLSREQLLEPLISDLEIFLFFKDLSLY